VSLRVLQIESGPNWGGQEERMLIESRWLRERGHAVRVICRPGSPVEKRARQWDLDVTAIPMRAPVDLLSAAAIWRVASSWKPNIVCTHSPKDAWLAAPLRLRGLPVIRWRNISHPITPPHHRAWIYRHGADRVIATAECIKRHLVSDCGVRADHVEVFGEFVDTREFHPDEGGGAVRAELGIGAGDIVFGIAAMLRGEKGHVDFLRAAHAVWEEIPSAKFLVAGSAPKNSSTLRTIEREIIDLFGEGSSPVHMLGYRRDIRRVFAAMDVLVVPSHREAQSRVVPQAFASRRAVIASGVDGLVDLVRHGETGLLVPPAQPAKLAEAMLRLARDKVLRDRLAEAGFLLAREKLDMQVSLERLKCFYKTIAGHAALAPACVPGVFC